MSFSVLPLHSSVISSLSGSSAAAESCTLTPFPMRSAVTTAAPSGAFGRRSTTVTLCTASNTRLVLGSVTFARMVYAPRDGSESVPPSFVNADTSTTLPSLCTHDQTICWFSTRMSSPVLTSICAFRYVDAGTVNGIFSSG